MRIFKESSWRWQIAALYLVNSCIANVNESELIKKVDPLFCGILYVEAILLMLDIF